MSDRCRPEPAPGKLRQVLIFTAGGIECGVDIIIVQEIHEMVEVAPVTDAPSYVDGVIDLFGQSIPVVDIGILLGIGSREHSKISRIVVVEVRSTLVGFIADAVREVLSIPSHNFRRQGSGSGGIDGAYVEGLAEVGSRRIPVLDLEKILLPDGAAPEWLEG
jgi:purine-binding chemotaxis protein CheW